MSDVEPTEPPAVLGDEPVAEPIVEEVAEEPVEDSPVDESAVEEPVAEEPFAEVPPAEEPLTEEPVAAIPAQPEPAPAPEETASDPKLPPAIAVDEATPTPSAGIAPADTAVDPEPIDDVLVKLETEPDAITAAPLAPIPEEAPAPLQQVASVPIEAEPAPVSTSATTPPQPDVAPDLSTMKTEVAKAAAAADTKSLAPSRKVRAKAKLLGKIVPKVAAFRAPKEAAPVLVLLTQKKKAGVDIKPIVEGMLNAAGA